MGRNRQRPPRGDRGKSPIVAQRITFVRVLAIGMASLAHGRKKTAVVHVGPHKTATTSIQSSTRIYKDAFRADGYLVVDYDPQAGLRNMMSGHLDRKPSQVIAWCSCHPGPNATEKELTLQELECDEGYYRRIQDTLSDEADPIRNHNLIFSMEDLDNPCVNVQEIRDLLVPHWEVRVVVGYRRFFEWAASYYYEQNRVDGRRWRRGASWPEKNATVVNVNTWWTEERISSQYHDRRYSTAVFGRYQDVFGDDQVSILNVHEDQDVIENFFCRQVPNATKACQALRTRDLERDEKPNLNRGGSTAYDEIAVAAYRSGLVDGGGDDRGAEEQGDAEKSGSSTDETTVSASSASRPDLREWIRFRQEKMLNMTAADIPIKCMPDDGDDPQLRLFLDLSLRAERSLVPSFYIGPQGEGELREEFERAAASKLCAVDTEEILRDPGWIAFFQSTRKRRPSSSPIQLANQQSLSRSSNAREKIVSWCLPEAGTAARLPMTVVVILVGIMSFFLGCIFVTYCSRIVKRMWRRQGRSRLYPPYLSRQWKHSQKSAGTDPIHT